MTVIMNKWVLLFLFFSVASGQYLLAQEAELIINPIPKNRPGRFVFENQAGSVKVTGYDGELIIVTGEARAAVSTGNSVYNLREVKGDYKLEYRESENEIILSAVNQPGIADYTVMIPRSWAVSITIRDRGIAGLYRLDGEIEVRNPNGDIDIQNINGPVVAVSLFGSIKVSYRSYTVDKPSMITSYDGDIELTVPGDSNISFSLRSDMGEIKISPGLNLRNENRSDKKIREMPGKQGWTNYVLNSGGRLVKLNTFYGNIEIIAKTDVTFK